MNLKPPTVLLLGPSGAGKTFSLATIAAAGLDLFVIGTEPNYLDTLLDAFHHHKLSTDRLHYRSIMPASPGWETMQEMAKTVGFQSFEDIAKNKMGIAKERTKQFVELLSACNAFVDEKDGKSYGSVGNFPSASCLVIDSLSGVNTMAMDLTIGMKPSAHQGEWGVAMNLEEKFLMQLTSELNCMLVVTAHVEKEINELTGARQVMVSALGRKLAPRLPRLFSEVVLAKRGKTPQDFRWSTSDVDVDLKNRGLEISDNLTPSFQPVWDIYQRRLTQVRNSSNDPNQTPHPAPA